MALSKITWTLDQAMDFWRFYSFPTQSPVLICFGFFALSLLRPSLDFAEDCIIITEKGFSDE